ncbi:DUF2971 domain-containing protein [Pseudoalteromonas rubra]|nr:DUF2971 domain-containing protein [Pseudoalteromonas rubra]
MRSLIPPSELEETIRQLFKQQRSAIEENFEKMGGITATTFNEQSNRLIGVLSLSELSTNLLMWSHYAHSHKGFCIGFDSTAQFFNQRRSESDEFYHLRKVEYSTHRPTNRMTQLDGTSLLLVKSDDWHYEQEWRMCARLKDAEKVIESTPYPIHLFEFPRTAVKEVILGACIENDFKNQLLAIIRKKYSHATVKQAHISPTEFKLEFTVL